MKSRLFVIKKRGLHQFWTCSSEHGTGWNPNIPKQAFSPSELTAQIRHMIDANVFTDVEVIQLSLPDMSGE